MISFFFVIEFLNILFVIYFKIRYVILYNNFLFSLLRFKFSKKDNIINNIIIIINKFVLKNSYSAFIK